MAHSQLQQNILKKNTFLKFDKLDQERIRYIRATESFAGSPPPNGVYAWSPLLEQTGQVVTYWKLTLHLHRSKTYISDRLTRLQLALSIEDSGIQDLEYVEEQVKKAWRNLRLVQKKARQHKESHMDKLADHFVFN